MHLLLFMVVSWLCGQQPSLPWRQKGPIPGAALSGQDTTAHELRGGAPHPTSLNAMCCCSHHHCRLLATLFRFLSAPHRKLSTRQGTCRTLHVPSCKDPEESHAGSSSSSRCTIGMTLKVAIRRGCLYRALHCLQYLALSPLSTFRAILG